MKLLINLFLIIGVILACSRKDNAILPQNNLSTDSLNQKKKDSLSTIPVDTTRKNNSDTSKTNLKKDSLLILESYGFKDCSTKTDLTGIWVEKYPLKFDRISDTIVFTCDSIIKKHFMLKDWKYRIIADTILIFSKDTVTRYFDFYLSENKNEITFYNFIQRTVTADEKRTTFVKIY